MYFPKSSFLLQLSPCKVNLKLSLTARSNIPPPNVRNTRSLTLIKYIEVLIILNDNRIRNCTKISRFTDKTDTVRPTEGPTSSYRGIIFITDRRKDYLSRFQISMEPHIHSDGLNQLEGGNQNREEAKNRQQAT